MTDVTPQSITSQIQLLAPSAIIELFVLDLTTLGGPVLYYHGGTNALMGPITFGGQVYYAFPVQATGFEYNGRGTLPTPKIQISNVTGAITALILLYGDLLGCKVIRRRTMQRYLDAVNFASGVNVSADPTAMFPDDIYFIEQRTIENRSVVEFQLAASFDFQGLQLPRRPIVQNVCVWRYRSAECSYTGLSYFDINDNPVAPPNQDVCGKKLSSCKCRFGQYGVLPFGSFPAAGLVRT